MKNIYLLLLSFVLVPLASMAQQPVYQRMAVPQGNYLLAANGSSKLTAYCLDYSRETPTKGVEYAFLLSQGDAASVEVGGKVYTFREALHHNLLSVEGVAQVEEGETRDMLSQLIEATETLEGESERLDKLREIYDKWDYLPEHQQGNIRELLLKVAADSKGTNAFLSFANLTSEPMTISLPDAIELGHISERAVGVTGNTLSSIAAEQKAMQLKVWNLQIERRQAMLKQIGFFPYAINGRRAIRTQRAYGSFQEAFGLPITQKWDPETEGTLLKQLVDLENALATLGYSGASLAEQIALYQEANELEPSGYLEPEHFQDIMEATEFSREQAFQAD